MQALKLAGLPAATIDFFAHGTTVVINALTERKGATVGLITTAGFRDVLEIARGNRPDLFNYMFVKPPPFVARHLRLEVSERLDHRGRVVAPLDLAGVAPIVERFRAERVDAVAICLLHAYANSDPRGAGRAGAPPAVARAPVRAGLAPDHARMAGVRADLDHRALGLRPPDGPGLSRPARAPPRRERSARARLHHAVERRRRHGARRRRQPDQHGRVGPGEWRARRDRARPDHRGAEPHRARHRGHDGQVRPGRGLPRPHHHRLQVRGVAAFTPGIRSRPRCSTSSRSAAAAAASRGSTRGAGCTSGRAAPAPFPAPPPTAAAASSPP